MSSINTNFYQFYPYPPIANNNFSNPYFSNGYYTQAPGSIYTTTSPVYTNFKQFYDNNSYQQNPYALNIVNLDLNNIFHILMSVNAFTKFNNLNTLSLQSLLSGRSETKFDTNGNKIQTQYDSKNQKVYESVYDANGNHLKDNLFDKGGKVTQTLTYNEYGALKSNIDKTYNNDGTVKDTVRDANGKYIGTSLYDASGKKIQDEYFDDNGRINRYETYQNGVIDKKVDRSYITTGGYKDSIRDASGKLLEDKTYDKDSKLTNSTSYNSDGTKVASTYDVSGTKTQEDTYNKADKITKSIAYKADGTKVETTFDANGKKAQDTYIGKDGKINHYDTYQDGVLKQKIDRVNNADGSAVDTVYDAAGNIIKHNYLNKDGQLTNTKEVLYRKGDGNYGAIDWNNDGKFGNDGGYSGYIAIHGDIDNFFTGNGYYFQTPDIEKILNNVDNTAKDKNSATGFVSNGIVTAHKISDTQFGFNITARDMSKTAGFNYDYVVWDKTKNSYIAGMDNNKDGNLTGDEIASVIQNVGKKLSSPLTFDLNGDGVKTSDKLAQYDIDGDGKLDTINDVADGTLAIRGGNSGLDVFGDNTDLDGDGKADGFANGFDALKALAAKEGLINRKDDMVLDAKDLKILEDKYQFGMKTGGYNSKAKSLAELGITEINLGSTDKVETTNNFDGRNNMLMSQAGATFTVNGTKRDYADVWHTLIA